jgi:hypothetical protein
VTPSSDHFGTILNRSIDLWLPKRDKSYILWGTTLRGHTGCPITSFGTPWVCIFRVQYQLDIVHMCVV